jgi:hypothetical protein
VSGLVLTNSAALSWQRATSRWGDIGWLTAWTLDGDYAGWGTLIDRVNGLPVPTIVSIDNGDTARIAAGALLLSDRNAPSLYGVGIYSAGTYAGSVAAVPRPYNVGRYSAGPYSRGVHMLNMAGSMTVGTFAEDAGCCPDAASWTTVVCGTARWDAADPCAAADWSTDALP